MSKIKVKRVEADASPLVTGDSIEFGLTYEIKGGGHSAWVKFGTVSKIREGESARDAIRRVTGLVHNEIEEQVTQVTRSL